MTKVVVSLTSYSARIQSVHKVIESLINQEIKADEIILWLSEFDFPRLDEDLPIQLRQLTGQHGFYIRWVKENLKSHKKYFYALQEYNECIVITVDDDMIYSQLMIKKLMESYRQHPNAISARNVSQILKRDGKIMPYIMWANGEETMIGQERSDLCAIGVNGILYPPKCASQSWFNIDMIKKCAENQDDLWLKYNEMRDGIPVVYAGLEEHDIVIEESQDSVLYIDNAYNGGNDNCIKMLEKYDLLKEKSLWNTWLTDLISIEDYCFNKEQYYKTIFDNIWDACDSKRIYICGAGKYAKTILQLLERIDCIEYIEALLVSNKEDKGSLGNVNIQCIGELQKEVSFVVICGVSNLYREEMKELFVAYEKCRWVELDMLDVMAYIKLLELIKVCHFESETK